MSTARARPNPLRSTPWAQSVLGFTLIELLITVAILATLASVALPLAEVASTRSKETELRRALREIRDGLDAYKRAADDGRIARSAEQSGYPPGLHALVEGVTDVKSPGRAKIYCLRRIPRDPFFPDPAAEPAGTWALRSYASPPDDPRPGQDVFDISSMSAQRGLNGVEYRNW
jgi:general secretion pathway protein G